MSAPLTRKTEQTAQSAWRLRTGTPRVDWSRELIRNEFLETANRRAWQAEILGDLMAFATTQVPWYRRQFRQLGIDGKDIQCVEDLAQLPVLTREELQANGDQLLAEGLPDGHRIDRKVSTSGSTGQPVEVWHSEHSIMMVGIMTQRELRWQRFDPAGTLAMIRSLHELENPHDKQTQPLDHSYHYPRWFNVGNHFQTGPGIGFADTNPVDKQVAWLDRLDPDYLIAQATRLEQLALAYQHHAPPASLRALRAYAQQLTPQMQERIETVFGVPVYQSYALNEAGPVAGQCREGGRLHVHMENCLVEVLNANDKPCGPGEIGRIIVTPLANAAMPLIRYDTGDLGELAVGPCPCGRTLPAFTAIHGRYRRLALQPRDSWAYWIAIQRALSPSLIAAELLAPIRQYQLHQYRNQSYELRIRASETLSDAFHHHIRKFWEQATGEPTHPLAIVQMDEIPWGRALKFENFTSDFVPPPDNEPLTRS